MTGVEAANGRVSWNGGAAVFDKVIVAAGGGLSRLAPECLPTGILGAGYLRFTLHPSAERHRVLVGTPAVVDLKRGMIITPADGGSDLTMSPLAPWTTMAITELPERPTDVKSQDRVKAFYLDSVARFDAPKWFPPKAAMLFYGLWSEQDPIWIHRDGRTIYVALSQRNGTSLAAIAAQSVRRIVRE